jgi:methenyltetrahydromethanopterin cyclohydrolase
MLATRLAAEGYQPLVIDCYGDEDMQAAVKDFQKVPNLSWRAIQSAVEQLADRYGFTAVIYGSGLERYPETLTFLQQRFLLLGNAAEVLCSLQQKQDFFKRLDQFAIPHPAIQFSSPGKPENWLFKPDHGEGGIGIFWAKEGVFSSQAGYWQQFVAGQPMSVLFLADGRWAQIVGIQRQLTERISGQPFVFAGVVTLPDFSPDYQQQIQQWLNQLVGEYRLVGLNSLDFILTDHQLYVLEINARPSASLQLYSTGLVSAHIRACLGKRSEVRYNSMIYGGYKIVFSDCVCQIPAGLVWPEWVCDRPVAGTKIIAGQPLCSLNGVGESTSQVVSELAVKEQQLIDFLKTGEKCNSERVSIN